MLRQHRDNLLTQGGHKASTSMTAERRRRVDGGGRSHRTGPRDVPESDLLASPSQDRSSCLEEIELLLVRSGLPPNLVLGGSHRAPSHTDALDSLDYPQLQTEHHQQPYAHREDSGIRPYCDPSFDMPASARMMDGYVNYHAAPVPPPPPQGPPYELAYIECLEWAVEELTEQQNATSAVLCDVAFRKDALALALCELEARQRIDADAMESLSHVQVFFYERRLMLREALWRSRLERECTRAAVAEAHAQAVSATLAERSRTQDAESMAQSREAVRALLADSDTRMSALVESLPTRVEAVLRAAGAGAPPPPPPPAVTGLRAEDLQTILASVLREQLSARTAAAEASVACGAVNPTRSTSTAEPAATPAERLISSHTPALVGPTLSPPRPSSPAAQQLSFRHQSLLFDKVVHILGDVEDTFTKASLSKTALATATFVEEVAAHRRATEREWTAVIDGKRAELKDLREQLSSLRIQKQQLRLSFSELASLPSSTMPMDGVQAARTAASVRSVPRTVQPAYEPYVAPYVPPTVQAARPPVLHSSRTLRAEALRLGARPAEYGLMETTSRAVSEPALAGAETHSLRRERTEGRLGGSGGPLAEGPEVALAAVAPSETGSIASPSMPPVLAGAVSLDQSACSGALTIKSFRPHVSSSDSTSSEPSAAVASPGGGGAARVEVHTAVAVHHTYGAHTLSEDESSAPAVKEATLQSSSKPTVAAATASVQVKKLTNTFDADSSSDSASAVLPSAAFAGAHRVTQASATSTVVPSTSPSRVPDQATQGLAALRSLLPSSASALRPDSAAAAAAAVHSLTGSTPQTGLSVAHPKRSSQRAGAVDDSEDSLSLTLTSSSDDGVGRKAAGKALAHSAKAVLPASTRGRSGRSSSSSSSRSASLKRVAVVKPTVKRSAFDDDDDAGDAPPPTKTPAAALGTRPMPTREKSAPVVGASAVGKTTPAVASVASKKTVSMPW